MAALHDLLARALPYLQHYGYAAIVAAILVEGVGIPAPGQTLLIGASILAGRGVMSLPLVVLSALCATVAGNNCGFAIGNYGGRRLILRAGVNRAHLSKLSRFYRRFGAWLVVFARFFDGARQLGSLLAGTGAMPWRRFFPFDLGGACLWVGVWAVGPYQLTAHAARLHAIWARINPIMVLLVVGAVVALGVWLWRPDRAVRK
ncbi:putative uncharacterized protein [Burkholderiales bacterium GJ-E10]|nr:putative uncharacterized protein [Burkholderiales bacterium GJ-E10]